MSCDCYACQTFTRAYIRHLIVAKGFIGEKYTLSIDNLRVLIRLMEQIRIYVADGTFEFRAPND